MEQVYLVLEMLGAVMGKVNLVLEMLGAGMG